MLSATSKSHRPSLGVCGFTETEREIFRTMFTQKLDTDIPALLFDLWDDSRFVVHVIPHDEYVETLQLMEPSVALPTPSVVLVRVEEFADYTSLPDASIEKTFKAVAALAESAAKSYAWNVRNAYLKGGRLRQGEKLHVTAWHDAFMMHLARNEDAWEGIHSSDIPGWVSYRYRFAAAKV